MSTKTAKEPATRLYLVTDKATDKPCALVEAANVQQARSHVARKMYDVKFAEQFDCIAAAKAGVEVESAKVEDTDSEG